MPLHDAKIETADIFLDVRAGSHLEAA